MKQLLFWILLCNWSEKAQATENLQQQQEKLNHSFALMESAIDAYKKSPCVVPDSKSKLEEISKGILAASTSVRVNYATLVAILKKDMDGQGDYNKSFTAVAEGSKARKEALEKNLSDLNLLMKDFGKIFVENFIEKTVDSLDNSSSLNCLKISSKLDKMVHDSDGSILEALNGYRRRIQVELDHFTKFEKANEQEAEKAGAVPGVAASIPAVNTEKPKDGPVGFQSGKSDISKDPQKK